MNEPILVTGRKLQISEATKRRNPHLFPESVATGIRPELQQVIPQTLDSHASKQAKRSKGPPICHILIVRYGARELDDDNLAASYKPCRDLLAAELGIDDGDPRIKFEYAQVTTKGETGTHVLISQPRGNNC